jgi:hypothetical protein
VDFAQFGLCPAVISFVEDLYPRFQEKTTPLFAENKAIKFRLRKVFIRTPGALKKIAIKGFSTKC